MNPEQAYQILGQACRLVLATLDEHNKIQQALQILKPKVKEVPKEKE
jgi:hypothetical protein